MVDLLGARASLARPRNRRSAGFSFSEGTSQRPEFSFWSKICAADVSVSAVRIQATLTTSKYMQMNNLLPTC